jgi:DNA polymerase-3 subunit epsilon
VIDLSANIWDMPIVVIDFESTGIDDDRRPVECAAIRFEQGSPVAQWSSLLSPGVPIPTEATGIHGITDEMVAGAPTLAECASDLLRVCKDAVPCAYSADFDRFMLHREITGIDCLAFDPAQSWLDPLVIIRDVDKYVSGKGKNKLENACKRRGIIISEAHRARADAIATGVLMWRLRERIGDISAAELIRRCDARRKVQDAEFNAWLARQPPKPAAAE